jgi:DNA-binding NtrC family response regulator
MKPGILVVDDDPMLLALLRAALSRQGLEVWTCDSGQGAVEHYQRHGERIGVVLLDVCMPGLDGPATLAELRRLNPAVQACFMSGYLGGHTTDALQALGAVRLYEKPFRLETLSTELGELARGGLRQTA